MAITQFFSKKKPLKDILILNTYHQNQIKRSQKMFNTAEAKNLLDEISFQVIKLESVAKEINSISELNDIKSNLISLKNFKIDTSRLEKELDYELSKIKQKIEEIKKQFDFSELDVISSKLKEIKKETQNFRFSSLGYVAIASLCIGYTINIVYPILPYHVVDKSAAVMQEFKKIGVEFEEQNNQKYILIPQGTNRVVNKQGDLVITINKIK